MLAYPDYCGKGD